MTDPTAISGPSLAARRSGFLAGAVIGAALAARTADLTDADAIRAAGDAPLPAPPGRRRAAIALGDGLLEELLAGGVDLRRLASRWTAWQADDGLDANPALVEALAHLREFNAPALQLSAYGPAPLAAALPAALTASSPRNMLNGTFHVARLLDPSETTALAAVAVVVAASRFLEGARDFIPDVLAVLRSNEAPPALFELFAAIPRDPRAVPAMPRGATPAPELVAQWALWHAHHRPRSAEVLAAMQAAGGVSSTAGSILGGLLGARDGLDAWPSAWRATSGEDVALRLALGDRLG